MRVPFVFAAIMATLAVGCGPKKPEVVQTTPVNAPCVKEEVDDTDIFAVPLDTSEEEEQEEVKEFKELTQEQKAEKAAKAKKMKASKTVQKKAEEVQKSDSK